MKMGEQQYTPCTEDRKKKDDNISHTLCIWFVHFLFDVSKAQNITIALTNVALQYLIGSECDCANYHRYRQVMAKMFTHTLSSIFIFSRSLSLSLSLSFSFTLALSFVCSKHISHTYIRFLSPNGLCSQQFSAAFGTSRSSIPIFLSLLCRSYSFIHSFVHIRLNASSLSLVIFCCFALVLLYFAFSCCEMC